MTFPYSSGRNYFVPWIEAENEVRPGMTHCDPSFEFIGSTAGCQPRLQAENSNERINDSWMRKSNNKKEPFIETLKQINNKQ